MKIVDFTLAHIPSAHSLALTCYQEERRYVPELPATQDVPNLFEFEQNGMGVAALEGERLLGFLCGTAPFEHAFGSTDCTGVFSPMGAHGAVPEGRERIYGAMYQRAAEKWVRAGAVSHGICLNAHDEAANRQFFRYGFGMRCVDSVRLVEPAGGHPVEPIDAPIDARPVVGYRFFELLPSECGRAYPLEVLLNRHCQSSPFFMNRQLPDCDTFCKTCVREQERCFVAQWQGEDKLCAYLKLSHSGETFISAAPDYRHITGAFCLEEHRGKGVYQNLLNYVIGVLKTENVRYLGVDFESINPAAHAFWSKYFSAYTHGVVRRIDERILSVI